MNSNIMSKMIGGLFLGTALLLGLFLAVLAGCSTPPVMVVEAPVLDVVKPWPNVQDEPIYAPPTPPVIYFALDSDKVSAEGMRAIFEWVELMKAEVGIDIIGHADVRGAEAYNAALGLRRAQAVARVIAREGIRAGLMEVSSDGEALPRVGRTQAESYALSRRVELYYDR
jgi:outer membrane protein OmpA-like peptidoglycan-associated protein